MRISCLNNYPLDRMLRMAQLGQATGQHGWGVQHLREAGHEVHLAPYLSAPDNNMLAQAAKASRHVFGQLDQELWAVRQKPDLIYSADQLSLAGVALTRRGVARRAKLISVVHHPMHGRGARVRAAAIKAHDAVGALSLRLCEELAELGADARFFPWGPDLASGLYHSGRDEGFAISTGKSNRDVATLVKALALTGYDGLVYDLSRTVTQSPAHVTVVHDGTGRDSGPGSGYLTQPILEQTRNAGFVAIPVADPDRLTGLTEINDALALGKPVVITRSVYSPVDVEAIGCGIVVEPGDVQGWATAIETLRDPLTRKEMGARGRSYAESTWNYQAFGSALVSLVEEVASR